MELTKSLLREVFDNSESKIDEINHFFDEINSELYENVYNIANPVLSRNPYTSNLLRNYLFKLEQPDSSPISIKILLYYLRSLTEFVAYLGVLLIFKLFGPSKKDFMDSKERNHYLIDFFLLAPKVLQKNHFVEESYLPGLYDFLEKNGDVVYLPSFYSMGKNPLKILKLARILNHSNEKILTEFSLLKLVDLLSILKFIILYPLENLNAIKFVQSHSQSELSKYVSNELRESISKATFRDFTRYTVAKRITKLTNRKLNVISWFENQTIDKALNRGFRDGEGSVLIRGCQLLPTSKTSMNYQPIPSEKKWDLLPDIILVNGPQYLPKNKFELSSMYRVGPSLRYKNIFSTSGFNSGQEQILILLPYYTHAVNRIIKICKESELKSEKLLIKFHPAFDRSQLTETIPDSWELTSEGIGDLLNVTQLVITSESGTSVEAICQGVSVLIIGNSETFTCDLLPTDSREIIWDIIFDSSELSDIYNKLIQMRKENPEEIKALSSEYRQTFFTNPTEELIVSTFGPHC